MSLLRHPDPGPLLESAAEAFLRPLGPGADPFASPPVLLVLRQGGLRDELFERAAAGGVAGWFDPPVAVFHELPLWLGATTRRPLGDFERAALLEHLIRREGGAVFQGRESAFLAAVDRLAGELVAEAVTAEQYRAAIAGSGLSEPFQRDRDQALTLVYAAYLDELARSGLRDGRDTLADVAAAVAADPAGTSERLGGRREIRIVGLADLKGGWRLLLEALVASPAVDRIGLYVTTPLRLPDHLGRVAQPTTLSAAERPGCEVEAMAGLNEDAELEAVAARARRLIEQGARPHRIAVIARDARPRLDQALRALEKAGVPASARRRVGLLEIPVIRAVLAVLEAAAAGWTRRDLVELGSQPYFASDVDSRVVNFIGYRERVIGLEAWRAAFDRLLAEARAAEADLETDEPRPRTLPSNWVERARERFELFTASASGTEAPRGLGAWLAWLEEWLEHDPWHIQQRIGRVAGERWDVLRLDLAGWRQLRAVLREWRDAMDRWPGDPAPLSPLRFLDRLRAMLSGDVALYTEVRRGVQVQEALAASHRSFDHVFLVGMNAGAFPRRPPSSLLLGEDDRQALRGAGLPLETTAEWEEREQSLFDTLAASAGASLTVSWVARDGLGGEANPSAFIESLLEQRPSRPGAAPELPVCRSPALAAHAERTALIERDRATGRPSAWNGLIESPDLLAWLETEHGDQRVWSPTGLEAYAKCPWSFFAERLLRLRARDDPDEDIDPRVRGTVLHDALHRFYDRARERSGGPVFLTVADQDWALALLREAVGLALAEAGASLWLGHPVLRAVKHAELTRRLERYLAFEIEENTNAMDGRTTAGKTVRTAVEAHELAFDEAVLERDGVTVRYRGIIDRVEVGVDPRAPGEWVAAVDYKTSKWSAPAAGRTDGWDDGVVLQVPLYAHALTQLRPGASVSRVEYRAITQATREHHLSLVRVKKAGVQVDAEAVEKMEQALRATVGHVRQLRAGAFPARPAPSCHCPPFCSAWDICRVAGGPDDGRGP